MPGPVPPPSWYMIRLQLLVTGKGERQKIEELFRPLLACGFLIFEPPVKIEQLSPTKEHLTVTGTEKKVINKRDEQIGLIARRFLIGGKSDERRILILLDDLEGARSDLADSVFSRYRDALDVFLTPHGKEQCASVHFLRNMLEAYYWADPDAVSKSMNELHPGHGKRPFVGCSGDVETIRHPKNDLKDYYGSFDEIRDGGKILENIDVSRVLGNPETCRALRTMFHWCIEKLSAHPNFEQWRSASPLPPLAERKLWPVTAGQCIDSPRASARAPA